MDKGRLENKFGARGVEIKETDCSQRFGHRQLVGRGIACGTCGSVIPAGPFDAVGWLKFGIAVIGSEPSPSPISKAEADAVLEAEREEELRVADLSEAERIQRVEIPKLHAITGWTAEGQAIQRLYDNRRELKLYERLAELEASAERHYAKARGALIRRGELAASS